MIDIIGAISLTAIFGLCCAVLIGAAPVETASRMRLPHLRWRGSQPSASSAQRGSFRQSDSEHRW